MDNIVAHMANLGVSDGLRVANALDGGQFGTGMNLSLLDASTPQLFTPTVFVVLQTPSMYDDNPEFARLIKNMVESHATSITGIDLNYSLETQESPLGMDGQMLEQPGKTKRAAISPSFVWPEKIGNLAWNMVRKWIWDMQHPDSNASQSGMASPKDMVPSTYAMTMMGLQFPPTMESSQMLEAALYCNLFPKETGDLGLERGIGTAKNMERTIPFSGVVVHNDYTREYGKYIGSQLGLNGINYNSKFVPVPEVQNTIVDDGLKGEADKIIASQG